MNQTPKIEFRKTRDFGQIFSDVTRFMKFNLKTIFVCVLFIPGPLFLIAGCFYGYMQSLGTDPSKMVGFGMFRDPFGAMMDIISAMLPYFIFLFLGVLASTATVDRYFILYQERGENNSIGVGDIMRHLPADVWRLFYNNLLLSLVLLLIMIPVVFIAMIPFLGIFAIVISLLLAGPQLAYALTAGSYLVLRDKILITAAFTKAWGYMRGNFWWTWLIVVVGGMIVGIMGALFTIPMTVLTVMNNLTRMTSHASDNNTLLYVILGTIAILGPQLLTPITKLFSVLAYHSYEEAEEGMTIKEKIDQLGTN
jgi:hypothetical protein